MMRSDFYATYACGHEEIDDTTMEVGSMSWCNTCKQSQTIVARGSFKPITPQDIHKAYNQTIKDKGNKSITKWSNISEESRVMYTRMAELLNEKLQKGTSNV